MKYFRFISLSVLVILSEVLSAKEFTGLLRSSANDKVTIKYNVTMRDGEAIISISRIVKQLGLEHNEKYKKPVNVKALFFERNGGFQNDQFNSGFGIDVLTINSDELDYIPSEEGYVWIEKQTELRLILKAQEATLSLPIYLVYYKKKHTYDVISYCGTLDIPLSQSSHNNSSNVVSTTSDRVRTITREEIIEEEGEMSSNDLAQELIEKISLIMEQGDGQSLPDYFETYTSELRRIEMKITDSRLKRQINDILDRAEDKKKEVEQIASIASQQAAADANIADMEIDARQNLGYVKERLSNKDKLSESDLVELKGIANELRRMSHGVNDKELAEQMVKAADECDAEMKKVEDAKKKRTVWMVIGGILLAIFMFVGNQAFQYFRNLRNQKGIADMQDKIVRQAENEARRRAQNTIKSRVNKVENAAIDKTRQTVRNGVKKSVNTIAKGKGSKNYSI